MEPEHIFTCLHIDPIVLQDNVVAAVQLFAPSNVDSSKVQAESYDLPERLTSDIGATDINFFKVAELLNKFDHSGILQVTTAKEADLSEKLTLAQFTNTIVCDLPALRK